MGEPRVVEMVGGPLDGERVVDATGYFAEGDSEAVDTLDMADSAKGWSRESVYRVHGDHLVYDAEATERHNAGEK